MSHSQTPSDFCKTVLVIGAYGLIGEGVTRRLIADGHRVSGFGRNANTARRVLPYLQWNFGDLRDFSHQSHWGEALGGVQVVVNCSGALQNSGDDDLEAVHVDAVSALSAACAERGIHLIQISSVGATEKAQTKFLSTKGKGDSFVRNSGADYQIFRPGLVLAGNAYGGTALLRMLAAWPVVQPIALPDSKIQTISLSDIAEVVSMAVAGNIPKAVECDLVENNEHSLREVLTEFRTWLGFRQAVSEVVLPKWALGPISAIADGLSRLGWRSPLRTTAMQVLNDGVKGQANALTQQNVEFSSLRQTLQSTPVGAQDRLMARMSLMMPAILLALTLFWLCSGLIGLWKVGVAAEVLIISGWSKVFAVASVVFWAVVDIGIGVAFAFRKYARLACWFAVGVSAFYLGAASIVSPHLWSDPLGPLVKVVPGILLAIVARITLDAR